MEIQSIYVSQRKLRAPEQLVDMIRELEDGGTLPPIVLTRDENGTTQVQDGHHRLTAIWLSGRQHLRPQEFLLVESERSRPRFGTVTDLLCRCGLGGDS